MSSKSRRKPGYTRPNRNRENLQLRGQIAQESSTDDVNENIKVTQQVRNSGKAIQNSDGRSSHPAITRIGQSDQVFWEQFRNELVTEQQPQIHDLLHQLPIRNSEISERNGDIDRQITLLCPLVEKDHSMEESYQAQELQSLSFISLDAGSENKRDERDLDNCDDVVPQVDESGVPQESNSFSLGRGVIGEPIATFIPK